MEDKEKVDWFEGLLVLLLPIGVPLGMIILGIYAIFFSEK